MLLGFFVVVVVSAVVVVLFCFILRTVPPQFGSMLSLFDSYVQRQLANYYSLSSPLFHELMASGS